MRMLRDRLTHDVILLPVTPRKQQGEWWEMVREVKEWAELRAWDTDELERRIEVLRNGLDIS